MRLVHSLIAAGLIAPSAALAGPAAAGAAIVSFFSSTAVVIAGVAITWGAIAFTAGSIVYGQAQRRKAKRRAQAAARAARDSFEASLRDRTISGVATEFPYRFIYGKARVGLNIVAMFTYGENDKFKMLIGVIANHEITSVDRVWVNGKDIGTIGANGHPISGPYELNENEQLATVTSYSYSIGIPANVDPSTVDVVSLGDSSTGPVQANYTFYPGRIEVASYHKPPFHVTYLANGTGTKASITVEVYHGSPGQQPSQFLIDLSEGRWNASHKLQNTAYVALQLSLDEDEFQGGLPAFEVLVRGKRVLDPRRNVIAWSENPALCLYDYLRGELCGIAAHRIPLSSVITAANDCDQLIAVGNWSGPRFTLNGVVSSENSKEEVIERMAEAMAGGLVSNSWHMYAGVYRAPVMALHQEDVIGEIALTPGLPRNEIYNTVKGQYVQVEKWITTDFTPYVNQTYRTADGEELDADMTFPFTVEAQRIHNLARIFMEDVRNAMAVQGRFSMKAWRLKIGDRVTFTSSVFGQDAKVYRITDKSLAPTGGIMLGMKEDDPSIWDLADATVVDATQNTNLRSPYDVPRILNLKLDSGDDHLIVGSDGSLQSRIYVTWELEFGLPGGAVDIEWAELMHKRNPAIGQDEYYWGPYRRTTVPSSQREAYLAPVVDRSYYFVRVRSYNPYWVARSNWTSDYHVVVGKTAPPDRVGEPIVVAFEQGGIRVRWPANADLDLWGYELRHGGQSWESAGFISKVTVNEYLWRMQASGTQVIRIKAIDTSGNHSEEDRVLSFEIAGPGAASSILHEFVAGDEVLLWAIPESGFTVDRYELRLGPTLATSAFIDSTKAQGYRRRADFVGSRTWWIIPVDVAGNYGTAASVTAIVEPPGRVQSMRVDVVDNNSLIYWEPPSTGTLPVERYEARKGASWAESMSIGSNGNSTFTTFFEQEAGEYTYWIAAVDTAGNFGEPVGRAAMISQPPDYQLAANITSAFDGPKTNAVKLLDGALLVPVNTSEDWTQHFESRGWTRPLDQMEAGFPIYIQPTMPSALYEEVIDYGAELPSTTIRLTVSRQLHAGVVNMSAQISWRRNPLDEWTVSAPDVMEIAATNFRYVRVRLHFTTPESQRGLALMTVNSLTITLSAKRRSDNGEGVAVPGGTFVSFNYPFIAAETPIVQPAGSTPLIPVVIYQGVANPTGFTVRLYNLQGVDVGGAFSWSARGY